MSVQAPKLPLQLDTAAPDEFADEATIEAAQFEDADWSDVVGQAISLDEVSVKKSLLTGAKLERFMVRDAIFADCDFSTTRSPEASFQRVSFSGGRMTGWDCSRATYKDVTFKNCKLDMANFRFTKLKSVRFVDCLLSDTDFLGAELADVDFENCMLERTNFTQAKLKATDLRSSQLIDLTGWQSLKGAIIDNVQLMAAAAYLANDIGIIVKD